MFSKIRHSLRGWSDGCWERCPGTRPLALLLCFPSAEILHSLPLYGRGGESCRKALPGERWSHWGWGRASGELTCSTGMPGSRVGAPPLAGPGPSPHATLRPAAGHPEGTGRSLSPESRFLWAANRTRPDRGGGGFKSKLIITGLPQRQTSLSGHVAKPSGDSTHKPSEASVSVLSHMLFWNFPTAPSKRGLSFPSPLPRAGW